MERSNLINDIIRESKWEPKKKHFSSLSAITEGTIGFQGSSSLSNISYDDSKEDTNEQLSSNESYSELLIKFVINLFQTDRELEQLKQHSFSIHPNDLNLNRLSKIKLIIIVSKIKSELAFIKWDSWAIHIMTSFDILMTIVFNRVNQKYRIDFIWSEKVLIFRIWVN